MRTRALLFLALALVTGCHKSRPAIPEVEMTVVVAYSSGQPVTDMLLTLHPLDPDLERPEPKLLDKSGQCVMRCQVGRYRATLAPIPSQGGASAGSGQLASPGSAPS